MPVFFSAINLGLQPEYLALKAHLYVLRYRSASFLGRMSLLQLRSLQDFRWQR